MKFLVAVLLEYDTAPANPSNYESGLSSFIVSAFDSIMDSGVSSNGDDACSMQASHHSRNATTARAKTTARTVARKTCHTVSLKQPMQAHDTTVTTKSAQLVKHMSNMAHLDAERAQAWP